MAYSDVFTPMCSRQSGQARDNLSHNSSHARRGTWENCKSSIRNLCFKTHTSFAFRNTNMCMLGHGFLHIAKEYDLCTNFSLFFFFIFHVFQKEQLLRIGGRGLLETTANIMKGVMGYSVQVLFSLYGCKGKKPFSSMLLCRVTTGNILFLNFNLQT